MVSPAHDDVAGVGARRQVPFAEEFIEKLRMLIDGVAVLDSLFESGRALRVDGSGPVNRGAGCSDQCLACGALTSVFGRCLFIPQT